MNDREERERLERIRQRAYRMWEEEGRPDGRAEAHWDMATELVAIEDNQRLAMEPITPPGGLGPSGEPIEPLEAVENAGEFPTMTDQGEQVFPTRHEPEWPEEKPASSKKRSAAAAKTTAGESKRAPAKKPLAGTAASAKRAASNGHSSGRSKSKDQART